MNGIEEQEREDYQIRIRHVLEKCKIKFPKYNEVPKGECKTCEAKYQCTSCKGW
jgi:hypothetical protein